MAFLAQKQHIYNKGVVQDAGLTEDIMALVSRAAPRKPLPFFVMDYEKHYNLLIEKAINRNTPESYTEKHHITPKCMGGSSDTENIVRLTGREHFVAHWLLHRMYPDNKGLVKAFHAMATMQRPNCGRFVPSSRAVAESREAFNKQQMKVVHSYTLQGEYHKTYNSIKEAAESVGVTRGNISTCINGRKHLHSVGGFQWSREKVESLPPVKRMHNAQKRKIEMLKDNKVIQVFSSITEAAKEVGTCIGNISPVLNGHRKTAKGYFWRYA